MFYCVSYDKDTGYSRNTLSSLNEISDLKEDAEKLETEISKFGLVETTKNNTEYTIYWVAK